LKIKPKIGIIFTSLEGADLDQDKLINLKEEVVRKFKILDLDKIYIDFFVANEGNAKKANRILRESNLDVICLIVGIWTADSIVLSLIEDLSLPIIVFTTSINIRTFGLDGALLISATLKDHNYNYKFIFGDIGDRKVLNKIYDYTLASAVVNKLRGSRIALVGHRPRIMANLVADETSLKKIFGTTIVPIGFDELSTYLKRVNKKDINKKYNEIINSVGKIEVKRDVILDSIRYYYAFLGMLDEFELDMFAINCFPNLFGKVCLALSNLNDIGITSSCEGDVKSAIAMFALKLISGRTSLNTDIAIEDEQENAMIFTHCGSGPFTFAKNLKDITFKEEYENKTGLAVCYPVKSNNEEITIVNLVGINQNYRMCVLSGKSILLEKLIYPGNPIKIKFKNDIKDIINRIGNDGFGHHWMVAYGNHCQVLNDFCSLLKIRFLSLD
jgi:L-fucose isomerase-like protein